MKLIIECEAIFRKAQITIDKIITTTCIGNRMKQEMLNSQINLTGKSPTGSLPRSKRPYVRYVCPILNLWILISSRCGKLVCLFAG